MKKATFSIILFLIFSKNYAINWSVSIDSMNSFCSPRSIDLNNDGTEDIVFGGGKENSIENKVVALDGKTGNILWKTSVNNEIYTSANFIDVNNDLIPDIIIGGRTANLYALDGINGNIIWQFYTDSIDPLLNKWYNFYEPQLIKDVNSDGIKDILITNGGNPTFLSGDTMRPTAGYLMILNSTNGNILHLDSMPDKKECYMAPIIYDFDNDGDDEIIFGTGGETIGGSLWLTHLSDLKQDNISNAIQLFTDPHKGFIQPPVLVDINDDDILDIVSPVFNGKFIALDGTNFQEIWSVNYSNMEMYTAPSVGFFNEDSIPDFFTISSKGIFPEYNGFYEIIIDGATGNLRIIDSVGYGFQIGSSIVYDKNNDGIDEVAVSLNKAKANNTYSNYLIEYDIKNEQKTILVDTVTGFNFGCTPLLKDIDSDNFADLIYVYNTLGGNYNTTINRINTIIPYNKISWGSYLGNDYNATFKNKKSVITQISNYNKTEESNCFKVYPTIFTHSITIMNSTNDISIFNSNLNNVYLSKNKTAAQLDLSFLSNGIYYIHDNKTNCVQKIIKM